MYGLPEIGYGGEVVTSLAGLIDAVKARQLVNPGAKLTMKIEGDVFGVRLLTNGWIELDGVVPTMALEKAVDSAMHQRGAVLQEVS